MTIENVPSELIESLLYKLTIGQVFVEFTKKNGEIRKMKCTKNIGMIPSEKHPKGVSTKTESVITVFDLEKNDWRSFDRNSVIGFSN